MKTSAWIVFLTLISLCIQAQMPALPPMYKQLAVAEGDLDKDGVAERAMVFDTGDSTEGGTTRMMFILKQRGENWQIWKQSTQAIMKSEDGGMMGDPFVGIEIKKGLLFVNHSGGSSWKWYEYDCYRYQQGDMMLIGNTSGFGKLCEYSGTSDFNLNTGKCIYVKETGLCEEGLSEKIIKKESETFYQKGIKITFQNRREKVIKLVSPKHHFEIFL